jgi:transcriptional regulator with XRE-family HTH domain
MSTYVTSTIDLNKLGDRIFKRRDQLDLSLRVLAANANCKKGVITKYENAGTDHPSIVILINIAKALKVDFLWLCFGIGCKEVSEDDNPKDELDLVYSEAKGVTTLSQKNLMYEFLKILIDNNSKTSGSDQQFK